MSEARASFLWRSIFVLVQEDFSIGGAVGEYEEATAGGPQGIVRAAH